MRGPCKRYRHSWYVIPWLTQGTWSNTQESSCVWGKDACM